MVADALERKLLCEAVLIGAVTALDAPFGLGRVGGDDLDAEFRARRAEGRHRLLARELLCERGFAAGDEHVLLVGVERLWYTVACDPRP